MGAERDYGLDNKILQMLLASSCFGKEVCQSPPCACAKSLADVIRASSPAEGAEPTHFAKVAEFVVGDDRSELGMARAERDYALHCLERELAIAHNAEEQLADARKQLEKAKSGLWLHGYNSCLHSAIQAFNYLSGHPRPNGGQDAYNAEHLLQIADDIKRTIAHNISSLTDDIHRDETPDTQG